MSESKITKVHKMKIIRGEKYHCDGSGCSGHIPATLVCSCGYKKDFEDPDNSHNVRRIKYEHASKIIENAGFVFELVQ